MHMHPRRRWPPPKANCCCHDRLSKDTYLNWYLKSYYYKPLWNDSFQKYFQSIAQQKTFVFKQMTKSKKPYILNSEEQYFVITYISRCFCSLHPFRHLYKGFHSSFLSKWNLWSLMPFCNPVFCIYLLYLQMNIR